MAKFNPRKVEALEYDFRSLDRYDVEANAFVEGEKCTGHGTVPEPSGPAIDELSDAIDAVNAEARAGKLGHVESRERMTELFVETIGLEREHLNELPPRQFNEFRDWLVLSLMGQ